MSAIIEFKIAFDEDLEQALKARLGMRVKDFRILSQGLDARGANRGRVPHYLYKIEYITENDCFTQPQEEFDHLGAFKQKPIIIGAGPAGLFCALRLAEYGVPTVIFERGESAKKRMIDIAKFWRYGELNPESNVSYGEGGAGLYSDGKLITRIKSPFVKYIMQKFVDFGAPKETAYATNPHLGSNKIRTIICHLTNYLKQQGHEIHYNTKVEKLIFDQDNKACGVILSDGQKILSNNIILATGHSAKEMYHHLHDLNVAMKAKNFAIGVRIEHPRRYIDTIQYGQFASDDSKNGLGAARYKLTNHNYSTEKGTYSFCMCPGGHVLSSGTDLDGIVVNGMSNFARNSPWSNSALVVTVKAGEDFDDRTDLLAGLKFQHSIEQKAFQLSKNFATGREIPAISLKEFARGKISSEQLPKSSCPSGIFKIGLENILPSFVLQHLDQSLKMFDQKLKGFNYQQAVILAPETRTSAPITITRDELTLESISHQGLYPCGEGAGHAGGITSAAVDGVKVAMALLKKEKQYLPKKEGIFA